MTEQQRRTVRAELARAMGWTINEMRLGHFCLIAPDGSYRDCFHSEPEDVWECERLPDPFTDAEDKDALVAWICANDYKSAFGDELLKALGIRDKFLGDRFPAEFHIADILNAPLETITIAAARALNIPIDAPPGQA